MVKGADTGRTAWAPKLVCEFARNESDDGMPAEGVLTLPENWAVDKELV